MLEYRKLFLVACLLPIPCKAKGYELSSPGKGIQVSIQTGASLTYQVNLDGKTLLEPSPISLTLDSGLVLGRDSHVKKTLIRSVDQVLRPVVARKRAEQRDQFNELRIDFKESYSVIFRAYDEGVAYRFVTNQKTPVKVLAEQATFNFPADHKIWFPKEDSFQSHQERLCLQLKLSEIKEQFCSLPAVVDAGGPKVAITEADLFDYPGMDLQSGGVNALKGLFPPCAKKVECRNDRDEVVIEREPYLAATSGARNYPWRLLAIARQDKELLENDLVYCLASETELKDTTWIKPGKVAWDWWNFNNLYGVDFRAGVNTATYKHYIDFAAKQGLQYVILDEGWYKLGDLLTVNPEIDMPELLRHAKTKGIGLILWTTSKTLDSQFDKAFEQFETWGIAGIKVDFMQREDQAMVRFYERTAREAAKRHLLVSFHGAYKPTGLRRTFPNVLTHEGVKGLENNKWDRTANPDNAVTFPFARMLAGPVDYTPGAMINAQKSDFAPIFNRPMSQGTRCHQLAMYSVFEAPLQMLADSPSNYEREPECLAFISKAPCTWDETQALDAKIGEFILMARRKGSDWYVGALTSWTSRDLLLDLSFLKDGDWKAEIFQDGINADRCAVDYKKLTKDVKAGDKLSLHLAPGGGWTARFTKR